MKHNILHMIDRLIERIIIDPEAGGQEMREAMSDAINSLNQNASVRNVVSLDTKVAQIVSIDEYNNVLELYADMVKQNNALQLELKSTKELFAAFVEHVDAPAHF